MGTGFVNSAVASGQAKAQTKTLVAGGQPKAPSKKDRHKQRDREWL